MKMRAISSPDYFLISPLINDWWGGRNMTDRLPKLFFDHFANTSFVVEEEGQCRGFLIGFLSQSHINEAYIHFAGVHPDYRRQAIGKKLYHQFFKVATQNGRNVVRCITSTVNTSSIAYHAKMGFQIEEVSENTDGEKKEKDKVLFVKYL